MSKPQSKSAVELLTDDEFQDFLSGFEEFESQENEQVDDEEETHKVVQDFMLHPENYMDIDQSDDEPYDEDEYREEDQEEQYDEDDDDIHDGGNDEQEMYDEFDESQFLEEPEDEEFNEAVNFVARRTSYVDKLIIHNNREGRSVNYREPNKENHKIDISDKSFITTEEVQELHRKFKRNGIMLRNGTIDKNHIYKRGNINYFVDDDGFSYIIDSSGKRKYNHRFLLGKHRGKVTHERELEIKNRNPFTGVRQDEVADETHGAFAGLIPDDIRDVAKHVIEIARQEEIIISEQENELRTKYVPYYSSEPYILKKQVLLRTLANEITGYLTFDLLDENQIRIYSIDESYPGYNRNLDNIHLMISKHSFIRDGVRVFEDCIYISHLNAGNGYSGKYLLDLITTVAIKAKIYYLLLEDRSSIPINIKAGGHCNVDLAYKSIMSMGLSWYGRHGFLQPRFKIQYGIWEKILTERITFREIIPYLANFTYKMWDRRQYDLWYEDGLANFLKLMILEKIIDVPPNTEDITEDIYPQCMAGAIDLLLRRGYGDIPIHDAITEIETNFKYPGGYPKSKVSFKMDHLYFTLCTYIFPYYRFDLLKKLKE